MRKIMFGATIFVALWLGAAVPATAQTITISGCASLTTSGGTGVANLTITCNPAVGGYVPPACGAPSITPVPNATAPTSLTLNATCTPGSAPITSVTAAGASLTAGLPTSAAYPITVGSIPVPTQTTKYVVSASDGTTSATSEVSYTPPGSPPPPPPGTISCADKGFTTTQYYDWDWAKGGLTIYTDVNASNARNPLGPIGSNGIVVIGFTPTGTAFGATGSLSISPYPGDLSSTTRTVSISTSACDFTPPFPWVRTGGDAGVQFSVGEFIPRVYPALVAGTRYYINIATRDAAGNSTCASAGRACDMVIQASRP